MLIWGATVCLAAPLHAGSLTLRESCVSPADFPVVQNHSATPILLDRDSPGVVRIAAGLLASDIFRVSGVKPGLIDSPAGVSNPVIVIGTRDSPLITDLFRREKLSAGALSGRWEAFSINTVTDPFPGIPSALVVVGSDRRGTAYGALALSAAFGVSPWEWWADVPVPRRDTLIVSAGSGFTDQPAVKYRGIFINDEDWGLEPWASKTFEPEVGNIGPKTYAKVFELMLRLRANFIWPGMHPTTTPFHLVPGNAATADRYAIIVGSSHAEPMLRTNGDEWKLPEKNFNFLTNRDDVLTYWEQRVRERTSGESLFTLGMRGIHDSPIIGPKNQAERIATLESIFSEQRTMLARHLGGGDATRVGQIFCPYKEVLEDYDAGLKVPEDVIVVWPDDNYGYIRRYASEAERARKGGLGVYYHASYSGMPQSWLWVDTQSPALIWSEMIRAYEQGAHSLWIVNVGDIKNTERSAEFFLDLAWHADRTSPDAASRFIQASAARDFGVDHAKQVADLLARMQAINFARRAEHLQWHLTMTAYQPTQLNEAEIASRLSACETLLRESEALEARMPEAYRDAYFQLVGYPVGITAGANRRYFHSELARADIARGRSPDSNLAAASAGQQLINDYTARYNGAVSGGKWKHIVTENGVAASQWKRFQRDTATPRPPPAPDNVCPPAPPQTAFSPNLPRAASGDFFELDRVVSIHAGHYTNRKDLPDGAGWRTIPGLGRTGSAVTVLPSTAAITPSAAPKLDYRFHASIGGKARVIIRFLPSYPIISGRGLQVAVSINQGEALPVTVTTGFDSKRSDTGWTEWQRRVMANATEAEVTLPESVAPGQHTLHLTAIDAGVVVDKIMIVFENFSPSYDGPPETRIP